MDIGLLDQDALLYPKEFIPNLEIMKLSSFYKKKRHYVTLILNPDKTERYSKILLRKDKKDNIYLSNLLLQDKCSYGGLAFTNGIYAPMDLEIENSVPDISIYNSYFRKFSIKEKDFREASFIRFSSNGKDCDLNYKKGITGSNISFFFVYDPNIIELEEPVKIFNSMNITSIHQKVIFVSPQYTDNLENLKNWCTNRWLGAKNLIIYDRYLYNKDFKELCQESKNFIVKPKIICGLDKNQTYTKNFLKQDLRNCINRAIYCIINDAKISFTVNKDLTDEQYLPIYKYLTAWVNYRFGNVSLFKYISDRSHRVRSTLEELRKEDSGLRQLTDVAPKVIYSKGGKWLL